MKLTFRDSFIKHLQANLLAISGMFSNNASFGQSFSEVIVGGLEMSTNKRVTAKSPNWQFARLVARLDRTLTSSSGRLDREFLAIVQRLCQLRFAVLYRRRHHRQKQSESANTGKLSREISD